jgi:hypothetical protein
VTTASISATAGAFLPKVNSQPRIAPRTLGSTAEGPGGDVYEKETALFRDSTRLTVGSLDNGLRKNEDGSVDVHIGRRRPPAWSRTGFTPPGKGWWPWFRLYGPQQALFEKTWKLPDIEEA